MEKLRQGRILVHNWHVLNWETEEQIAKKKSVDKRGAKSDEAYVREVLGEMANARDILVINDEAHHAWRVPAESKVQGVSKSEVEEATKWIGGLDRIHRARGILRCHDFTATPFVPSGQAEQRGGPVRVDRQRLRAERRHRGRVWSRPRGSSSATTGS